MVKKKLNNFNFLRFVGHHKSHNGEILTGEQTQLFTSVILLSDNSSYGFVLQSGRHQSPKTQYGFAN